MVGNAKDFVSPTITTTHMDTPTITSNSMQSTYIALPKHTITSNTTHTKTSPTLTKLNSSNYYNTTRVWLPPTNWHKDTTSTIHEEHHYHYQPPTTTNHLPPTTDHLPPPTNQPPATTNHLPTTTNHLPPPTTTIRDASGGWFSSCCGSAGAFERRPTATRQIAKGKNTAEAR